MAIIKLGATVVGIRGTIAGVTYSANKAGPHAKGWTRGANPRTTLQAVQRNRQSTNSANWRALTAADQAAWNTWAALPAQQKTNSLGVLYSISGFAWYTALSTNLVQAALLPINTAPVLVQPAAPTTATFTFRFTGSPSNSRVVFSAVDPTIALNKVLLFMMTNSIGRSVSPRRGVFMRNQVVDGTFGISFQGSITARFGNIPNGAKGFLTIYNQNAEGYRSPPLVVTDIADS